MRQRIAGHQGAGPAEALLRGGEFGLALRDHGSGGDLLAFPLSHQRPGGGRGVLRPAYLGAGLGQLGFQHLGIHAGQDLALADEIALVHADFRHASGQLGGHIQLSGLDAPVTAGESLAQTGGPQPVPGSGSACRQQQCQRPGQLASGRQLHLIPRYFHGYVGIFRI
ncbi:hypothetical protein D9M68_693550 [compost metagenome]